MNGKQRIKAALDFQAPDKVPYAEYAVDGDIARRILGHDTFLRSKAKCMIALWEGRRDEVAQSLQEDTVALYKKLDCLDAVNLMAEAAGLLPPKDYQPLKPKQLDEKTWQDAQGRRYVYSESTKDITMVSDPRLWEKEHSLADFAPDLPKYRHDESEFEVIDYVINALPDRFIILPAGQEVGMVLLGNMQRGLVEMMEEPELIAQIAQSLTQIGNAEDAVFLRKGGDAIMWGQDFASNHGSMISPTMFAKLVAPYCAQRTANVKRHGKYVIKHACGNNAQLFDQFIGIGYDCYQSIQKSAGMDILSLQSTLGQKMCLWGGVQVEDLIAGNTQAVCRQAEQTRAIAQHGGIILGASHSVAIGTNYDTYMAFLDTL